jgi:hypothetical protein
MLAGGAAPAAGTGQGSLTVHLTGNGSGAVVSSDGHIDCSLGNGVIVGNRCDFVGYSLFTNVSLTVTSETGSALCDNDFVCHSEGETDHYVVQIAAGANTWNGFFGLQNRYIAVLKSGPGSGSVTSTDGKISCPVSCQETDQIGYTFGDPVTLHAVAASGSAFDGWIGSCVGQGATCTFKMTSVDPETSTTVAFKIKATPTPGPTHTPAPSHTAAPASPGQSQVVTEPGASPTSADPAGSGAASGDPALSPSASAAGSQPSASPAAVPASTAGSVDTGWVAFLVLLVLVIGVSIGGGIAFMAMRRRSPPPST